jgi:hypothetical protein
VAPLRLGGLRGKQSTPSVWLGGTGEFLWSASRSGTERGKRHSARDVSEAGEWQRYDFNGEVESSFIFGKIIVIGDNMMRLVGIMVCNFVPQ